MERRNAVWSAVAICVLVLALGTLAQAQYGGGSGTPDDPYLIYTPEQLNAIGADPNDWDKHFKLMADIDLSTYSEFMIEPIGSDTIPFTGMFDGNGRTISNVTYHSDDGTPYVGLFGYVNANYTVIKNLALRNPQIDCPAECYVGALVGYLAGGTITYCCVQDGVVTNLDDSATSADANDTASTSTQAYNLFRIRGDSTPIYSAGGLVGENTNGIIIGCYSSATVIGNQYAGGLVGYNNSGILSDCYSAGLVSSDYCPGGLIGSERRSNTNRSFWDMEASGQTRSDSGTGLTTAEMQDPNTFQTVGWDFFGPKDGPSNIWTVDPNTGYPVLWWQALEDEQPELVQFSGGTGTADDPYQIASPEQLNGIGYNPKLIENHFQLIADIDLADMHFFPIGSATVPFACVFDGNGWTISNLTIHNEDEDYVGLFRCVRGSEAEIRNVELIDPNIDAGTGNYVGALAGCLDKTTVTDCHVSGGRVSGGSEIGGLVGYSRYAKITDCHTTTVVTGRYGTGGLIAYNNSGIVSRCHSTGAVTGETAVGGLLGYNRGVLIDSYSTGTVVGSESIGGLVAHNTGDLIACYATGTVVGIERVGGLVGYNYWDSTVTTCYSAGSVVGKTGVGGLVGSDYYSDITASFWDIETSGMTESAGGVGLTTVEMMTAETFLEAGWDFVGEVENGVEDVWWIDEGVGYPRLWWESAGAEF